MHSAKRVTLVPPDQSGSGNENLDMVQTESEKNEKIDKIKFKIYDKIHRFIKVILKLAKLDSYDDLLRIKTKNGNYLDKSNIVDLLTHSMSAGKVLHGEEEFIALLARSGVDPELILNENVKSKLIGYSGRMPANSVQKSEITQNILAESEPKNKRKRVITVNNDKEIELELSRPNSFKRKIDLTDDNEDEMDLGLHNVKKPKISNQFDEDSVDDSLISPAKWRI